MKRRKVSTQTSGRVPPPAERLLDPPASVAGGERPLSWVLVYPNRYAVGMANLGFQTVFSLLSASPDALCHRAFSDFPASLETGEALSRYDVVAFSLSFEGDYPEVLRLMEAGGVPFETAGREEGGPLVVAGGVGVSLNPEPLAPFIDAFFVGEAEAGLGVLPAFLARRRTEERRSLLRALAERAFPGIYVPSLYKVEEVEGRVVGRQALGAVPEFAERVWARPPWEPARTHVLPEEDAFGGAYLLEVSRGCPHACRFCAAGYLTRPVRFHDLDALLPYVELGVRAAGRVGFVGAAVSDHPDFRELARAVLARGGELTVSSFRVESLDAEVLELLLRGGLKTLTVAIEAGSERLRSRIGKSVGKEDLLRGARLAGAAGLRRLRIYAMLGLPGEEEADVRELSELVQEARGELGSGLVTVSVAAFVPKAQTPLQWEPMAPEALLRAKMRLLERPLRGCGGVRVVGETPKWSRVQGFLARGGRSAAPLLAVAARTGNWREILRLPAVAAVLDRPRDLDEVFPWDFIRGGPSKEHLLGESKGDVPGGSPIPCRPGACRACGVCS
jgi:radical SAM superfamily enzyme YgiQ (UPF0313 family)